MTIITVLFVTLFSYSYASLPVKVTPDTTNYGSVILDWTEYDYANKNFKVYKSVDGVNYESVGVDYSLVNEVRVLNIYPTKQGANNNDQWGSTSSVTFTSAVDGNTYTLPKQASLKMWMEKAQSDAPLGYGKGIITVTAKPYTEFNQNPSIADDFDVIMVGSWNHNGDNPLNENSYNYLVNWIKAGKGLISGHDSFFGKVSGFAHVHSAANNYNKLRSFHNIKLYGLDSEAANQNNTGNSSNTATIVKKGLLTNYPWNIGEIGTRLSIPTTHTSGQIAYGDVWLKLNDSNKTDVNGNGCANFYLTTYNNTAMIQTGHSKGSATTDEQKIIANALFYLNQLLFNTYTLKDSSAQDVAAPDAPSFTEIYSDKVVVNAEDNGSTYYYYVKSYSKNDTTENGLIDTSDVRTIEVKTGVQKYRYTFNNTLNTTLTLSTGTETTNGQINYNNSYQYLHVAAVDGAGNISETVHYELASYTAPTIGRKLIDVTGAITDTSSEDVHNCNDHIIGKYDNTYHWNECSICSTKYVKAGRPDDSASWENSYLEIKQNASGQRILVIKNSKLTHSYITDYWSGGGESDCSEINLHIKVCNCGYSTSDSTGRANHTYGSSYIYSGTYAYIKCTRCNYSYRDHTCKDAQGAFSCTNTGVCSICGHNYSTFGHSVMTNHSQMLHADILYSGYCSYCNQYFGTVKNTYTISDDIITFTTTYTIQPAISGVTVNLSTSGFTFSTNDLSTTYMESLGTNKSQNGNVYTLSTRIRYKNKTELNLQGGYHHLDFQNLGWWAVFFMKDDVRYFVPELTAPTILNIQQNIITSYNGWATNSNIIITGTENYCNSVKIQMIDNSNNGVVYYGTTNVSNNGYELTFTPDITVGEVAKPFTIKVEDALGNYTTQTIYISRYDRKMPEPVKTGQIHFYYGDNMWSTPIPWSKTKDFSVIASDESTDYVESKIQNVTSAKTNEVFIDSYAMTSVDTTTSPKKYQRDYTFTGDVKGYVTIKAIAKDYANNVEEDYFRVYNLDNLEPVVDTPFFIGDSIDTIGASLYDAHSGIKYFGMLPYEYGYVNYPTTYPNTDSTIATELNRWYKVAEISANATTGEPAHGQERVEVQFKITENGKYYIIAEDYVGNRGYAVFEANRFDTIPPYGTIELKNPKYSIANVKGTDLFSPILLIEGHDDDTSVAYMSFANENSRSVISWIPYETEHAWTLSSGDGYKTVYVMFRDEQGNVSVSYTQ